MTRDRRSKQAIRARMAESGLKYTEARRDVIGAAGGDGDGGSEMSLQVAPDWPEDVLGGFTDQAYNQVLLAEDEARMLGRAVVEPEHLLLAFARRGNAERLLGLAGVSAADIYQAIVARVGLGDELVRGRVPRSVAAERVLRNALLAGAACGVRGPSSEYVLLALTQDSGAGQLLGELGAGDLRPLIYEKYPIVGPAIDADQALSWARQRSAARTPPRPGPMPPVFERYAGDARAAIDAGERCATELMHHYVEPMHFLVGCAQVPGAGVESVLVAEGVTPEAARDRARACGPRPAHQATGIFSDEAREIVAESALYISLSMRDATIDTRHLLLATLKSQDPRVEQIIGSAAAMRRIAQALGQGQGNRTDVNVPTVRQFDFTDRNAVRLQIVWSRSGKSLGVSLISPPYAQTGLSATQADELARFLVERREPLSSIELSDPESPDASLQAKWNPSANHLTLTLQPASSRTGAPPHAVLTADDVAALASFLAAGSPGPAQRQ